MTAMNAIERETRASCAVLALNRPQVLNALNDAMLDELDAALDVAEHDASRALVITARGRAFCAGTDLHSRPELPEARVRRMHALIERMADFPKISVAAINGLAYGGGLELALACTFRVAVAGARLALPEVKLALIPAYGGTQLLPRLIGASRALEMMLSGEPVDAEQALAMGLVDHVCADAEALMPAAIALAERCSRHSLVPQRAIRRLVRAGADLSLADALALERRLVAEVSASDDAHEGVRAFREKRAARFSDR